MLAAARHAEGLLAEAEAARRPLSFAFVVPSWEQLPFHQQLLHSRWLRGGQGGGVPGGAAGEAILIPAESHGFVDGAQHLRPEEDRLRASSFGTTVAVLQTEAGARRWPVDASLRTELVAAFEGALPAAAAARARMERGGADGGTDAVAQLLRRREAQAGAAAAGAAAAGAAVPAAEAERAAKRERKERKARADAGQKKSAKKARRHAS
jgi:hypothetical protein